MRLCNTLALMCLYHVIVIVSDMVISWGLVGLLLYFWGFVLFLVLFFVAVVYFTRGFLVCCCCYFFYLFFFFYFFYGLLVKFILWAIFNKN